MKKIRKICKNCKLYNPEESTCSVSVIHEGEYLELKVKPNDRCWWLKMEQELFEAIPIQQVMVQYDLDGKKIKVEAPLDPPSPFA